MVHDSVSLSAFALDLGFPQQNHLALAWDYQVLVAWG